MTNTDQTHSIVENDAAIINISYEYDSDIDAMKHSETRIETGISSYDSTLRCRCGEEFETLEQAKSHLTQ